MILNVILTSDSHPAHAKDLPSSSTRMHSMLGMLNLRGEQFNWNEIIFWADQLSYWLGTISGATDWQRITLNRSPSLCPGSSPHSFRFSFFQLAPSLMEMQKLFLWKQDKLSGRSVPSNPSALAIILLWGSLAGRGTRSCSLGRSHFLLNFRFWIFQCISRTKSFHLYLVTGQSETPWHACTF